MAIMPENGFSKRRSFALKNPHPEPGMSNVFLRQTPFISIFTLSASLTGLAEVTNLAAIEEIVEIHCHDCHGGGFERGGLDLEAISGEAVTGHRAIWEKVILRMDSRQMPPPDEDRPDEAEYRATVAFLSEYLDQTAPIRAGRVPAVRRMTRHEYRNAIRDLLSLDIEVTELLPKDDESHGFDNITVGTLPPVLLNRYLSAAQKISRLAVGLVPDSPQGRVIRLPADMTQESHVDGLPPGSRGGTLLDHVFPAAGEYEIELRLTRDRDEQVEGLQEPHQLVLLLDGKIQKSFDIAPIRGKKNPRPVDAHLNARLQFPAGPAKLGVTFLEKGPAMIETGRLPYDASFNLHRHARQTPAIYQVSITGPFGPSRVNDTPSRKAIFTTYPKTEADEAAVARTILASLARRAFRRPVTDRDLETPLGFYQQARETGGFDEGIEAAVSVILSSPKFLLRVEPDDGNQPAGKPYPLDDVSLASRLSFFLWSSIPDEELIALAERGELSQATVLKAQVKRMLADPRSSALITNFASQWLHLRNLDSVQPDLRIFPDFDDNLRDAMRRETELFFGSILRENRPLLELLTSRHTYLNERLARHYGLSGVSGNRFRRIELADDGKRGGILRQASVLSVTSYANRTSPVIRGNWILETVLGTPTPPPPPEIPMLDEGVVSAKLPMRERLAAHSKDRSCAACHVLMDPVGFAFENFDATGRWREFENERPVDNAGGLPDGTVATGADELIQAVAKRPSLFTRAFTSKMMVYALGRGLEPFDQTAIRRIMNELDEDRATIPDIIAQIATSIPFTMKENP
jgi:mono/diheme cytochrome c family protein